MKMQEMTLLLDEISFLGKRTYISFPYKDCWKIFGEKNNEDEDDFISYLDMFFSDIAGYSSWGGKILDWSVDELEAAHQRICKSFFERHPRYKQLECKISASNTPDLHAHLATYEALRQSLIKLFSKLKVEIKPVAE